MEYASTYPTAQIHHTAACSQDVNIYGSFYQDKRCRICHEVGITTFKLAKCENDTNENKYNHYFCKDCAKYITDVFPCCRSTCNDPKGDPKNGFICDSCQKIHNQMFALHIINTLKIKNAVFNFALKTIDLTTDIERGNKYFDDIIWKCEGCGKPEKRSSLIKPDAKCDHSTSLYCQAKKRCCDHYFCKNCFHKGIKSGYSKNLELDIEIVPCFSKIRDRDNSIICNCTSYFARSTLETYCEKTAKDILLTRLEGNTVACSACKTVLRITNKIAKKVKCTTPGCLEVMCGRCKQKVHYGSCQTQDRITLLKNGDCKPCPYCYNGIEKNTLNLFIFEITKESLKDASPVYFSKKHEENVYLMFKKPNDHQEYYKWFFINDAKEEKELINQNGQVLGQYILVDQSKNIIGNWVPVKYDRYIEDATITADILYNPQETLTLKPIVQPKDSFELKNSKGVLCGYFKKLNINLWCGLSSNKKKYWVRKEPDELLNDGKLFKYNEVLLNVKENDLSVFQEICETGQEKERIVFADKDQKVITEGLAFKLTGWYLQTVKKEHEVYLKQINEKKEYKKCEKKASFKKIEFGEGCEHIKCIICSQDCCIRCCARRDPILKHGNNYHRPSCPYYSYALPDDKTNVYNDKCNECIIFNKKKKRDHPKIPADNMVCPPPMNLNENNDIPDSDLAAFELE